MKQNPTSLKTASAKLFVFSFICFIAIQTTEGQICSNADIIYGINSGTGAIYPVNVTNANVSTQVNTTAYSGATGNANGLGYNPVNGKFYYFQVNPGTNGTRGIFLSYDPVHNIYATLDSLPAAISVNTGCVNANGTGFYCTDINGNFYYYSIAGNTWTTITSNFKDQTNTSVKTIFQNQNSGDMAFDGYGNLWIVVSNSTECGLYEITAPVPTTAQTSVTVNQIIAPTTSTPDGTNIAGIAFGTGGQMYLSCTSFKLYELTTTYSLQYIGLMNLQACNDLTSCSFPLQILPVSWGAFTATYSGNNVDLKWSFSAANNVKGFYAEKSTDNKNWQELGYAPYNVEATNYSAIDASPAAGINYYRIREEDIDGQVSYSSVKMITVSSTTGISIWPNPAKDVVNINYNGAGSDTKAMIFDQLGRMISSTVLHSGSNPVNVSNLSTGNYIVHVQSADGTVFNGKMIKK